MVLEHNHEPLAIFKKRQTSHEEWNKSSNHNRIEARKDAPRKGIRSGGGTMAESRQPGGRFEKTGKKNGIDIDGMRQQVWDKAKGEG